MISCDERIDGAADVAQAERPAVARVAAGVVRPGQDDPAQRVQRGSKILRIQVLPGPPSGTGKELLASDHFRQAFLGI